MRLLIPFLFARALVMCCHATTLNTEQQCAVSAPGDPDECLADVAVVEADNENVTQYFTSKNASLSSLEPCNPDAHDRCAEWAERGECKRTPVYMHQHCRTSCGSCSMDGIPLEGIDNASCVDKDYRCSTWAEAGECQTGRQDYMSEHCRKSCRLCPEKLYSLQGFERGADIGVPQQGISNPKVAKMLVDARLYMIDEAPRMVEPAVLDDCRNKHENCAFWATLGECDANPAYMKMNCAPVCKSCDFTAMDGRCPIDADAPKAWAPGDLDRTFRRMTSDPALLSRYNVQTLSSPATGGPWVITMDDVILQEEADKLIGLGTDQGYERSTTIGGIKADGTYHRVTFEGRTSFNTWCERDCYDDEDAQAVMRRMSNITGIPEVNSEYLQLLRYERGQFYKAHSDYSDTQRQKQAGVRILTMYVYLNDVQEGGGTNFDKLGLTVTPKRGRAVLWPSVLNDDPDAVDERTSHQALPVVNGVKYGANAWFHSGDYKAARANGCG